MNLKNRSSRIFLPSIMLALSFMVVQADDSPATGAESGTVVTLKDRFADDFLVGATLNRDYVLGTDPKALDLVREQFSAITPENLMKWERIEPEEGKFDWEAADRLIQFAEENGLYVAGHVLVWHQQTPDWVFEDADGNPASRELLLKRMENHINALAGRYRGRIQSWEVVNEVFEEDGSFRQSPWFTLIGEDFIEKAFEFAQAADPDAYLYFNDYNMYKPEKRDGAIRLGQKLLAKGLKLDGIGLQVHYGLDNPEDLQQVADSIEAIAGLGVDALVTEMDLSVLPFPGQEDWGADITVSAELQDRLNPYAAGLPAEVEAAQAQRYSDLFRIFLQHREHISRVTFWGLIDEDSWKNNWPVWGRTDYPLLFDRNYRPKAAFHAITRLEQ